MEEVEDLELFYSKFRANSPSNANSKTLDLGCGGIPRNPFKADLLYGIDIRDSANPNIARSDLAQEGIPHGDASMDYITAFDFIEHVPRVVYLPQIRYSFIELMNEEAKDNNMKKLNKNSKDREIFKMKIKQLLYIKNRTVCSKYSNKMQKYKQ
jgi:hypothetical protein